MAAGTPVRDVLLTADGDIDFSDGRSFHWTSGTEAVAQHAKLRLAKVKGAWFLDSDEGTDWLGVIFRKGATDSEIEDEIRQRLAGTPGVGQVSSVSVTRNPSLRTATIRATGETDIGEGFILDFEQGA